MFPKIKIGKTILEGVKRALKINVSEATPDEEVDDAIAKAIKIATRTAVFLILYKMFPDFWEQAFSLIFAG